MNISLDLRTVKKYKNFLLSLLLFAENITSQSFSRPILYYFHHTQAIILLYTLLGIYKNSLRSWPSLTKMCPVLKNKKYALLTKSFKSFTENISFLYFL
jgi:hypothetical protein